jgi:hypothetical protein
MAYHITYARRDYPVMFRAEWVAEVSANACAVFVVLFVLSKPLGFRRARVSRQQKVCGETTAIINSLCSQY